MDTTVPLLHCTMDTTVLHSVTQTIPQCLAVHHHIVRLAKTQCASTFSARVVLCSITTACSTPVLLFILLVRVYCVLLYAAVRLLCCHVLALRACCVVFYACCVVVFCLYVPLV